MERLRNKFIIILPLIFLVSCTLTPKKYKPQPIVIKELTAQPGASKTGSLLLYAEEYKSPTNADFSKAGLKVVLLTLQNTSHGDYGTIHQIFSNDIHGIGTSEYMQYPLKDAVTLMNNSTLFKETVKGATTGILGGAAVGVVVGSLLGAIAGDAGIGAATGAIIGGTGGGFEGAGHYRDKAIQAIADEFRSRILPTIITIPSDSKINGTMFFPQDVHTLKTNIEGTTYEISIHIATPSPVVNK